MSQTGYTPIQLYRTTTSGAAPVSGNLNPGELAININDADMALYAKNNTGTVKRLINNPAGLKYPTADGTANQAVVTDGAGNLTLGTPTLATTATTATNVAGGSAGTIPYQTASGTTAMLAVGTTGQVLTSNGAAAPTWSTPAAATKTISNQVGAYTVVAGDLGKIINCTSGTFTVSLTAAASLGSGFTCTIWNTSNTATDVITIDPNAAETIDGVATLTLQRGEGLAIVCDGTNWQTDDKKPMRGYAENYDKQDTRPSAGGSKALAIGRLNNASGDESTAIGTAAISSGVNSLSIGVSTTASARDATAIGDNSAHQGSQATGAGAMALGGSYASGTDSFAAAISNNTSSYGATGANSIAMGYQSKATNTSYAIGTVALASGSLSTAIGSNVTASGTQSVAIGQGQTASANYSTAIGSNSGGSNTGSQAVTGAGAMALGGSYASGTDSFAAAISNNTSSYGAKGSNSVAIGQAALATGSNSIAINGYSTASAAYSIAINSATATAINAVAIGGSSVASGFSAYAFGNASRAVQSGKYAYASGFFGVSGDAQYGKIVLLGSTTTTTAVVLTSDGAAASTTNQLIIASGQAMAIQGTLIAKQSGSGNMAGWNITGIVSNNGGTMAVSGLALTAIGSDSITLGASPTIAVDNTNKGVTITSGYKSATSIRWVCCINTSEVLYA
jgi:Head domain of trimeric autotransporter adhesin